MKQKVLISTVMVVAFTIISRINEIVTFVQNVQTTGNMDWLNILSGIGSAGLIVMLIYFAIKIGSVASFIETEKIELKEYQSLKKSNEELIQLNKQLIAVVEDDRVNHNLSLRLFRDGFLIPTMMQDTKSQQEYAQLFFHVGLTRPELEKYFMTNRETHLQPVIDRFMILFHADETRKREEKLKKKK